MLLNILFLVLGFFVLVLGADWLVNGASSLAKRFNISELVIGLTIVAFGTSAPELVVNLIASSQKLDDVVLGNVIGSNIFNLLLILGVSGVILPIVVQTKTVWREIPFSLFIGILVLALALLFAPAGQMAVSRFEGVGLLVFFGVFMVYIFQNLKSEGLPDDQMIQEKPLAKTMLFIVVGLAGLIIGGRLVVNNAVEIARFFDLSEKLIGLTIVSIGTSLPELATSVAAALRKKADLAIGNVIGSNIFNMTLILGLSALVDPIDYSLSFNTDLFIFIGATLFLFVAMFTGQKQKLDRWEAGVLLVIFVAYMAFLIIGN